jgi:hypothetical protein
MITPVPIQKQHPFPFLKEETSIVNLIQKRKTYAGIVFIFAVNELIVPTTTNANSLAPALLKLVISDSHIPV